MFVLVQKTRTRPFARSVMSGKRKRIRSLRSLRPTPSRRMSFSELFQISTQSLYLPFSSVTAAPLALMISLITSPL